MNNGTKLAALAAFAGVAVPFVLYSVLARRSSTSSSITKGNNNNRASQSNVGLSILLDSAREYYVRGDYKMADIFFEKVLEVEPNHIETLNNRGIVLSKLADYHKAKNCLEKVLKMDPKNIVALNNIEILNKKKDEATSQQKERPAAAAAPPSVETTSQQKVVERPAAAAAPPSVETTSQQKERPAPSPDSGTISRADSRNPYNDPTLPGYNPNLGKKKEDASQQKVVERPAAAAAPPSVETTSQQKERPAPAQDSGTISPADSRNPYNDPTLPGYNPDPELGMKKDDTTQKLEKPPAPAQASTQKLEKPPAPAQDSGTISPADSRNPYNDP